MRIAIPITGSRGDVWPYVALGKGLQAVGHEVDLVTHEDFAPAIRREGLGFESMGGSAQTLHNTEPAKKMMSAGADPIVYLREFARLREPIMTELMADCLAGCCNADLILLTQSAPLLALSVAEKLALPIHGTALQPTRPSRHRASCFVPELPAWFPGRSWYNIASSLLVAEYLWQLLRTVINRAREQVLDLPPFPFLGPSARRLHDMPSLHGYSEHVVPRPPDWGENQSLTGFWFVDSPKQWQPPRTVVDFLDAGPAPIYIGFGSMRSNHCDDLTRVVLGALKRTGQRGIISRGWGGLDEVTGSDQFLVIDSIPHDWLFPRVAAVIHHGGAGTTAAGLRAGVPSLLIPFCGDQIFWGRRIGELGVGPRPIPQNQLTVERLADGMRTCVRNLSMRQRARDLGMKIRSEGGIYQAADLLDRSLACSRPPVRAVRRRSGLRAHVEPRWEPVLVSNR